MNAKKSNDEFGVFWFCDLCLLDHEDAASANCHWPDCETQVPPAMWGCKKHWFALPQSFRSRIWLAYRPGQEINGTPSEAYLQVTREVQDWIKAHQEQSK